MRVGTYKKTGVAWIDMVHRNSLVIKDAPAVRDVEKGAEWRLEMGDTDSLSLVSLSKKQSARFDSQEALAAFVQPRSAVRINFDHDRAPPVYAQERAESMFRFVAAVEKDHPDLFEQHGWPKMEPQPTTEQTATPRAGGVKAAAAAAASKAAEPKATKTKTADRGDAR
jgi:hypothetical protein